MTEKPIIFSTDMVKAILADRKTQTRRPMNPQPPTDLKWGGWILSTTGNSKKVGCASWVDNQEIITKEYLVRCPYGKVGDRLWVRETWAEEIIEGHYLDGELSGETYQTIFYKADENSIKPSYINWQPSIHMPLWASRIALEITGVRVQRIQEIAHKECELEGANDEKWLTWYEDAWNVGLPAGSHIENIKEHFANIWNGIYGKTYPWESNPWVWVIEFRRINP